MSNLPGSSVHGVFQATVLDWIAISFSKESSQPRDWTQVSHIVDRRFTVCNLSQKAKKQWDLFKNIRDTKGTFHTKMGSIKDRNGMDLTEAEEIKKRWQECTEELYKKDLRDPDNHDGVITHLD